MTIEINFNGTLADDTAAHEIITRHIEENLVGSEFEVYTEDGANEAVADHIKESVWAFRAEFIADRIDHHSALEYTRNELIRSIEKVQELCEGANALLLAAIEDFGLFVDDAISFDGCGHFLNPYDGGEEELIIDGEAYYIYRQS